MRNVCKKVYSRPTDLFCRFFWNDSACSFFSATTTQLFSQILSSHTICSCLEILSTTNNLCKFWRSKFQQVSTYAFCGWDCIFTQNWICHCPNNLCMCTESPSTLSTNTSTEWNLYLSWSNHLVTSFRLEMNIGSFFEHQHKTSDTDRFKGYFFTARASQVKVNTMKRFFEQRSELQVAKCPIVHVLSSSQNVSSLELQMRGRQRSNGVFVSPTILYSIRSAYMLSVCGQGRKQNLVFEDLFVSTLLQIHYQPYFRKCVPDQYWTKQDPIFQLQSKSQLFAFFEAL